MDAPMPLDAPVTTATLPSSFRDVADDVADMTDSFPSRADRLRGRRGGCWVVPQLVVIESVIRGGRASPQRSAGPLTSDVEGPSSLSRSTGRGSKTGRRLARRRPLNL